MVAPHQDVLPVQQGVPRVGQAQAPRLQYVLDVAVGVVVAHLWLVLNFEFCVSIELRFEFELCFELCFELRFELRFEFCVFELCFALCLVNCVCDWLEFGFALGVGRAGGV